MSKSDDVRKAMKNVNEPQKAQIFWAEIIAVDEQKEQCTIKILSSGLEIDEVLLSIEKSGIVLIPEIGSQVLACSIENQKSACYLIAIEKVIKYILRANEKVFIGSESGAEKAVKGETLNDLLNSILIHLQTINAVLITYGTAQAVELPVIAVSNTALATSMTAETAKLTDMIAKVQLHLSDKVNIA